MRCARVALNFDIERTTKKFNFEMCPIRHFKNHVVKLLDCCSNFVLAVDAQGSFVVFWIDEHDQENDNDSLQKSFQVDLREEPVAMYLYPAERVAPNSRIKQRANEVVIVTGRGIHHFEFGRENQQVVLRPMRMIPLPAENLSNVYSCEISPKVIFVSSLPGSLHDIGQNKVVFIY